ncbi:MULTISPECIES: hypothetical protein [unclassified Alcanivorax]|uniref:hypothetical protein n=1 Tax=unclassified Alcanivorax TaxID=2638842 RepID=UPI0008A01434|nr:MULTISPECIES: hypothetical protein [unclassified Alcanivorax]MEE3388911.1 hypothetical protein [Pseudomonadota bacterium]SEG04572.1 hypothetical protein SAMN04515663_106202 [Alcanivorax sp. DSM 26293]
MSAKEFVNQLIQGIESMWRRKTPDARLMRGTFIVNLVGLLGIILLIAAIGGGPSGMTFYVLSTILAPFMSFVVTALSVGLFDAYEGWRGKKQGLVDTWDILEYKKQRTTYWASSTGRIIRFSVIVSSLVWAFFLIFGVAFS